MRHVGDAVELARSPGELPGTDCRLCDGTGDIVWTQPVPVSGSYELREMRHPCINGCSGWWHPRSAEQERVVESINAPALEA
jgi:hypothetical protein